MMFLSLGPAFAKPVPLTVSRLFTDRAVLQRDRAVPIWGTCAPGLGVTLSFGDQRVTTVAGADGRWRVDLAPRPADAEGRDLLIQASDGGEKRLSDVVVGDVWLGAGQSNMELGMAAIAGRAQEMKDLKYPSLRLYLIPKSASGRSRSEVFGVWVPSDRASVTSGGWSGFSAVAYTFGRRLQRELGVPVGMIQAAYGGSPISAWIPPEDLAGDPAYSSYASRILQADRDHSRALGTDPQARHPFDDPVNTADLGPASVWRAMVEPLGPLALKGVLWYQGETDVGEGPFYAKKMTTLIQGWRRTLGQPGLPFYFVQLAPWSGYGGDSLPRLWAAQSDVLTVPATGMALTVDVGDFDDIHPANKRPVGERLALQALAKTYGRPLSADGPVFAGWNARKTGAFVSWTAQGGLATADGAPPTAFELFDAGGTWVQAQARLAEGGVVLEGPGGVTAVRYAWSAAPKVNLTDAAGLPARPFSTLP